MLLKVWLSIFYYIRILLIYFIMTMIYWLINYYWLYISYFVIKSISCSLIVFTHISMNNREPVEQSTNYHREQNFFLSVYITLNQINSLQINGCIDLCSCSNELNWAILLIHFKFTCFFKLLLSEAHLFFLRKSSIKLLQFTIIIFLCNQCYWNSAIAMRIKEPQYN